MVVIVHGPIAATPAQQADAKFFSKNQVLNERILCQNTDYSKFLKQPDSKISMSKLGTTFNIGAWRVSVEAAYHRDSDSVGAEPHVYPRLPVIPLVLSGRNPVLVLEGPTADRWGATKWVDLVKFDYGVKLLRNIFNTTTGYKQPFHAEVNLSGLSPGAYGILIGTKPLITFSISKEFGVTTVKINQP